MDEVKSVGLFLFLDCFSIFSFINLQYSNKYLGGSQYCFRLKEPVSCKRLCKQEVMGICEEFGSFNEMQLDTGVCFHICNDSSIGLPQSHTHEHTQTPKCTHTIHTESSSSSHPEWTMLLFHQLFSVYTNYILSKIHLEKYKLGVFRIAFTSWSHRFSE